MVVEIRRKIQRGRSFERKLTIIIVFLLLGIIVIHLIKCDQFIFSKNIKIKFILKFCWSAICVMFNLWIYVALCIFHHFPYNTCCYREPFSLVKMVNVEIVKKKQEGLGCKFEKVTTSNREKMNWLDIKNVKVFIMKQIFF